MNFIENNDLARKINQIIAFEQFDSRLGMFIRAQRKARNLTQGDLAEKLNITPQQMQKYESGKNKMNAEKLFKLLEIFNCSAKTFSEEMNLTNNNISSDMLLKNFEGIRSNNLKQIIFELTSAVSRS